MTAVVIPDTASPSRRMHASFAQASLPSEASEGAGNAGRSMHPQPRVQNKKAHELVTTGSPELPGIPARNGFNGFLRALPGDRAFFVTVAYVMKRKLDASVEASGPHDFAVRISNVRQRCLRVHRIPPRVRDDRDTPLWWDETAQLIVLIWVR